MASLERPEEHPGGGRERPDQMSALSTGDVLHAELAEIAQRSAVLPTDYYAHVQGVRLLGETMPGLDTESAAAALEGLRQGEAAVLLSRTLAGLVLARSQLTTDTPFDGLDDLKSQAVAGVLYGNGLTPSKLVDASDLSGITFARQDLSKLRQSFKHITDEKRIDSLVAEGRRLALRSVTGFTEELPTKLHDKTAAHTRRLGAGERVAEPQRRLLSAVFPTRLNEIAELTYDELVPLAIHMVGAIVLARYRYVGSWKWDYVDRMASLFIDRFYMVKAKEAGRINGFDWAAAMKISNLLLTQLVAYDSDDRDDLFCAAYGLEPNPQPAKHASIRRPPADIKRTAHTSKAEVNFSHFYPSPWQYTKPSLNPRPVVLPSSRRPAPTEGEPWYVDSDLLAVLASHDLAESLPSAAAQLSYSLPGRFALTQADRQLLDAVFMPVLLGGNSNTVRLPSLEAVNQRPAYRHMPGEEFRQLVITTVEKLIEASGGDSAVSA